MPTPSPVYAVIIWIHWLYRLIWATFTIRMPQDEVLQYAVQYRMFQAFELVTSDFINMKWTGCRLYCRDGVATDRIVGFHELGGVDDFPTSALETRLLKKGTCLSSLFVNCVSTKKGYIEMYGQMPNNSWTHTLSCWLQPRDRLQKIQATLSATMPTCCKIHHIQYATSWRFSMPKWSARWESPSLQSDLILFTAPLPSSLC
jgi:hypothetical protein